MMTNDVKVTVWNEYLHETQDPKISAVYPSGIHNCIADFLRVSGFKNVRTATLREPDHGLTDEVLESTDVMLWWGHMGHDEVSDEIVAKVHERVMDGMGMVVLHSGHASKIFKKLCGTATDRLKWRESGEKEIVWVIDRTHPIADGIDDRIILEHEEMYGEPFEIPSPDALVFAGWFEGGEVFRSGCCFRRGKGRIFYFQPGHEAYPIYYNPQIQRVIINAIHWAKASFIPDYTTGHCPIPAIET